MSVSLHRLKQEEAFAADVRAGLGREGQKTLPSKYFYDPRGSDLFEAITRLPEYGLTRADERVLLSHGREIVESIRGPLVVAELGSGSATKTRHILEAAARRGSLAYHPIEISPAALRESSQGLGDIPGLKITAHRAEYLEGLREVVARVPEGHRLLLLFLGSSIGNFAQEEAEIFLAEVRALLQMGDVLLLGTDLVKPVHRVVPAYDDEAGVTAAFNLNILARINRELGANFELDAFEHKVRYDVALQRVEMHLRSRRDQQVSIPGAGLTVGVLAGETIWTESSHKYRIQDVVDIAARSGFLCEQQWVDQEWPFAESLLRAC